MKKTINLLPQESPEEKEAKQKRRRRIIIALSLVFFVFLGWLLPFIVLQTMRVQENALNLDIEKYENSIKKQADVEQVYRNVFNKVSAANVVFDKQRIITDDVRDLKKFVGEDLTLRDVSLDKTKITMTVNSVNIDAITSYLGSLEKEGQIQSFFKNLIISSVSIDKLSGFQVKLEGTLSIL